MRKTLTQLIVAATATVALSSQATEQEQSLVTLKSHHSVQQTADRLVKVLNAKNMTVFTRIDHSKGAQTVGLDLAPTQVVIFGNPKVGTPLMHCAPTIAIDLPQKALIWQDPQGAVWYAYNKPSYLKQRHTLEGCERELMKIEKALAAFANAATMAN